MTDGNLIMTANGLIDKSKELQKEILMEKLRSQTPQYKNLTETSKAVRTSMLVCILFTLIPRIYDKLCIFA